MLKCFGDLVRAAGVTNGPAWLDDIGLTHQPMPHQMETMRAYPQHLRFGDFSDPGCVSADTEFLTSRGWKRIDQYQYGDKVAQFWPKTHTIDLVAPLEYVKKPCVSFMRIYVRGIMDQLVSSEHRVLYYKSLKQLDQPVECSAMVYADEHGESASGHSGKLPTCGYLRGHGNLPISEAALRVMVAVIADGSFRSKTPRCRLSVIKQRKVDRMHSLLQAAGIPYLCRKNRRYTHFAFDAPRREKIFTPAWYSASISQRKAVLDEAQYWDSSIREGRYIFTSKQKESADYIQFCAATTGRTATLSLDDRGDLKWWQTTVFERARFPSLHSSVKCELERVRSEDGFKYCFSVPSTYLLLRRNGKIFATGNTGKTYPAQAHGILMASLSEHNKGVYVMPPKLIEQFRQEMTDFFPGVDERVKIDTYLGTKAEKDKKFEQWEESDWPQLLMLSYESFRALNDAQPWITVTASQLVMGEDGHPLPHPRNKRRYLTQDGREVKVVNNPARKGAFLYKAQNPRMMFLKEKGYNFYFFDEAHTNLCNQSNIAYLSVKKMDMELGDDVALYLMTGTPLPTKVVNVYPILKLLNPCAYVNQKEFYRKHVILDPGSKFEKILGYRNLEKIHEELFKYARRVEKRDVLPLEEPIITCIPVRLAGPHKRLYDKLNKERYAVVNGQEISIESDQEWRMLGLRVIAAPEDIDARGVESPIAKANELRKACDELIASINPEKNKVLVFASFKSSIRWLADHYKALNPIVINGDTKDANVLKNVFNDDPECRMAIVNWQAGGAGLNLQKDCSHVVFYETPSSPKDAKQPIARVYRMGQKNIVNVYFFRVMGTLADRKYQNLLANEESNNVVVGDAHDLLYRQLRNKKRVTA